MNPEILVLYVGIFATLIGISVQLVQTYRQGKRDRVEARKIEAEAAQSFAEAGESIAQGAGALMEKYENRFRAMELEVANMKKHIEMLDEGILVLVQQLRRAGLTPDWTPPARYKSVGRDADQASSSS